MHAYKIDPMTVKQYGINFFLCDSWFLQEKFGRHLLKHFGYILVYYRIYIFLLGVKEGYKRDHTFSFPQLMLSSISYLKQLPERLLQHRILHFFDRLGFWSGGDVLTEISAALTRSFLAKVKELSTHPRSINSARFWVHHPAVVIRR